MSPTTSTSKIAQAEAAVADLLRWVGEDPSRDGLKGTPNRVVRALKEMTAGYGMDPREFLAVQFEKDGYDEMVVLRDVSFHSLCEHHMLPFSGVATVGYIPGERVVGLSKLARVVECYARRLQIQERMTRQIATALQGSLQPAGVGVIVQAHHSCMGCRGVGQSGSQMVTSALLGAMLEAPETRAEFLALAGRRT